MDSNSNRAAAAAAFVDRAIAAGHVTTGERAAWVSLYTVSPDRAELRLQQREQRHELEGAVTGGPRDRQARAVLAAHGVDYDVAVRWAGVFGAGDPRGAIAKHCAGVE